MSRDAAYLLDILRAAQLIMAYAQTSDEVAFKSDLKTQDAIVRRIEIIGEATKQLSHAFRAAHPQIP